MRKLFVLALAMVLALASTAHAGESYGVYVKAVEKAQGGFDGAVKAAEEALKGAGWRVLASYASGVEARCGKKAHNIVVVSDAYAGEMMKHGPRGAFASVLRVGVYDDRDGVSVAFTNPASLNRTILGDGAAEELSKRTMQELSKAISSSVAGTAVNAQIGQLRDKGHVGGMGGGEFLKKIEEVHAGGELPAVAEGIRKSIAAGGKGWRLVYSYETPGGGAVIFGLAEPGTEAKAFDIAGESREKREKYSCPGLDHAAAFPIEVVAYASEGGARVVTLDEMYRMKLYFEDAGNWAFMKNATMPGRIEREVVEAATSKLK